MLLTKIENYLYVKAKLQIISSKFDQSSIQSFKFWPFQFSPLSLIWFQYSPLSFDRFNLVI